MPSSNTTASVFSTDDITPVAPQSASPSATRPARLQGEGTAAIKESSRAAPSAVRWSWSEILATMSCRPVPPAESTSARIVATKVASGTSENSARYEIAAANCEAPSRL